MRKLGVESICTGAVNGKRTQRGDIPAAIVTGSVLIFAGLLLVAYSVMTRTANGLAMTMS